MNYDSQLLYLTMHSILDVCHAYKLTRQSLSNRKASYKHMSNAHTESGCIRNLSIVRFF